MKAALTIIGFACVAMTVGRTSNLTHSFTKIFDTTFSLVQIDTLQTFDIVGMYVSSNGTAGYRLILDSNQNFQTIGFDCMSNLKIDSGQWTLLNGKTLILKSDDITKAYDFFKLDNYIFIIPQLSRQKFIHDYMSTKTMFKNANPLNVDGKIILR